MAPLSPVFRGRGAGGEGASRDRSLGDHASFSSTIFPGVKSGYTSSLFLSERDRVVPKGLRRDAAMRFKPPHPRPLSPENGGEGSQKDVSD